MKAVESSGQEVRSVQFSDMQHGWIPRGDLSKENVARDVAAGVELIIEFLKKHT